MHWYKLLKNDNIDFGFDDFDKFEDFYKDFLLRTIGNYLLNTYLKKAFYKRFSRICSEVRTVIAFQSYFFLLSLHM